MLKIHEAHAQGGMLHAHYRAEAPDEGLAGQRPLMGAGRNVGAESPACEDHEIEAGLHVPCLRLPDDLQQGQHAAVIGPVRISHARDAQGPGIHHMQAALSVSKGIQSRRKAVPFRMGKDAAVAAVRFQARRKCLGQGAGICQYEPAPVQPGPAGELFPLDPADSVTGGLRGTGLFLDAFRRQGTHAQAFHATDGFAVAVEKADVQQERARIAGIPGRAFPQLQHDLHISGALFRQVQMPATRRDEDPVRIPVLLGDAGEHTLQAGVQQGGIPAPTVVGVAGGDTGPGPAPAAADLPQQAEGRPVRDAKALHGGIIGRYVLGHVLVACRCRRRHGACRAFDAGSRGPVPGPGRFGGGRGEELHDAPFPVAFQDELEKDVPVPVQRQGTKQGHMTETAVRAVFPGGGRAQELEEQAARGDAPARYPVFPHAFQFLAAKAAPVKDLSFRSCEAFAPHGMGEGFTAGAIRAGAVFFRPEAAALEGSQGKPDATGAQAQGFFLEGVQCLVVTGHVGQGHPLESVIHEVAGHVPCLRMSGKQHPLGHPAPGKGVQSLPERAGRGGADGQPDLVPAA